MKTKMHVTAGGFTYNHNEMLVCDPSQAERLRVRSRVRTGSFGNDNETLVQDKRR